MSRHSKVQQTQWIMADSPLSRRSSGSSQTGMEQCTFVLLSCQRWQHLDQRQCSVKVTRLGQLWAGPGTARRTFANCSTLWMQTKVHAMRMPGMHKHTQTHIYAHARTNMLPLFISLHFFEPLQSCTRAHIQLHTHACSGGHDSKVTCAFAHV